MKSIRSNPLALSVLLPCLLLAACTTDSPVESAEAPIREQGPSMLRSEIRTSQHRGDDDLLSAGLGLEGLRSAQPPALADPLAPSAAELRRRAIWTSWRGIADLAPGGGFAEVYGRLPSVPGREFHAFAGLPDANHAHRVMLQLPDSFDARRRCLLVTASSGSRGIYGAISLAGGWGLPRGCAVAYTDKGAGSGFVDLHSGLGAGLSGLAETQAPEFAQAAAPQREPWVALKHAHSGDHPEADWGRHLRQAAEFGLARLSEALPDQAPFSFDNTTVIAVGVSNGAAAVLRAAEDAEPWLDAAVAIAPNVHVAGHGRPAYDYGSEAALLMPCALLDPRFEDAPFARQQGEAPPLWRQACAAAAARGSLSADSEAGRIGEALARLHAGGWSDTAIAAGALSVSFEMWRSVGSVYASAYLRRGPYDMPCGFHAALVGADGKARAASAGEVALWASDSSGIPTTAGVQLVSPADPELPPALAGLSCLRQLWTADSADAVALREAISRTQAGPPRAGLPLIVAHGLADGLIPDTFSSAAYVAQAEATGRPLRYWQLPHVQHFDAFLGLPPLAARYLPLMPYAYRALDITLADLERDRGPVDARLSPAASPRGMAGQGAAALTAANLALPED